MNIAKILIRKVLRQVFETAPQIAPAEWAKTYRRMSSDESAYVGRFSFVLNPYFEWLLNQYSRPDVRRVVCQKPAQIGWTQSVILNLLGWYIHVKKTTAIVMFPKEGAARNFDLEKFRPMVESTPALSAILPVRSRTADVKTLFKKFVGGFVKFVGSNSISDVKSTSGRDLVVEEPDDCNLNLRGQGDSIKLLEERGKTFRDVKFLVGGTPSVEGVSSIVAEMELSDKNYWEVPCPDCATFQRLDWRQVDWLKRPEDEVSTAPLHPVYGRHRPDTARYKCVAEDCDSLWSNAQKNAAIQKGRAQATAPFNGVVGLYLNELYAPWHESRMVRLVEKFLEAKHEESKGDSGAIITFWNATLGLPWRFKGSTPDIEDLKAKAENYTLGVCPAPVLLLSAGIDIQHNRLALIVRGWRHGEESWLVWWEEKPGTTTDITDGVWDWLEAFVLQTWQHEKGYPIRIGALTLDSGDGATTEAAYAFVRRLKGKGINVMAGKGASSPDAEIFSRARLSIEVKNNTTKASRYGVRPYMVGVDRAKDLLLGDGGRVRMQGSGPGRFHYPEMPDEYFKQLTSEVKVPRWHKQGAAVRSSRSMLVWSKKTSVRNEVLDCENYALHAARSMRAHLLKDNDWLAIEQRLAQAELLPETLVQTAPMDGNPADVQTSAQPAGTRTKAAADSAAKQKATRDDDSDGKGHGHTVADDPYL
jgi:phage terminase large subunit GpA-like protein